MDLKLLHKALYTDINNMAIVGDLELDECLNCVHQPNCKFKPIYCKSVVHNMRELRNVPFCNITPSLFDCPGKVLAKVVDKDREIELLKSQLEVNRVRMLQYDNLRKYFNILVDHVLGEEYYNMGMDVYACDKETCQDLEAAMKKRRRGT